MDEVDISTPTFCQLVVQGPGLQSCDLGSLAQPHPPPRSQVNVNGDRRENLSNFNAPQPRPHDGAT